MTIRLILADDHQIMRQGLREMLQKMKDVHVIAEAEEGRTALKLAQELEPDVIVMDVTMPDMNGIEATRQIMAVCPRTRIVALSMQADRRFVNGMLSAGAAGYLLKDCAVDELAGAIRTVAVGRSYLSPAIVDLVVKDYSRGAEKDEPSALTLLSAREREVLQYIAEGNSVKEIAAKLSLSVKTIETHRQQIMDKLNVHNIAGLTKIALKEGLTSLDT